MTKKKKPTKKAKTKAKSSKPKKKYFHRECHLCLANIEKSLKHECIPLTEQDLFKNLPEDFQDAYRDLRRAASGFGEQKIYNNAHAVMFSRRVCYMFIRPKKTYMELCFFLPRQEKNASVFKVTPTSKTKFAHIVKLVHSDQVEAPLTNWLREAYGFSE